MQPWALCLSRRSLVRSPPPLRFECSIGVSSSANTVFYSLTLVLCTAVTSTSASPCSQTSTAFIFAVLILFLWTSTLYLPTCITKSAHALLSFSADALWKKHCVRGAWRWSCATVCMCILVKPGLNTVCLSAEHVWTFVVECKLLDFEVW